MVEDKMKIYAVIKNNNGTLRLYEDYADALSEYNLIVSILKSSHPQTSDVLYCESETGYFIIHTPSSRYCVEIKPYDFIKSKKGCENNE